MKIFAHNTSYTSKHKRTPNTYIHTRVRVVMDQDFNPKFECQKVKCQTWQHFLSGEVSAEAK